MLWMRTLPVHWMNEDSSPGPGDGGDKDGNDGGGGG